MSTTSYVNGREPGRLCCQPASTRRYGALAALALFAAMLTAPHLALRSLAPSHSQSPQSQPASSPVQTYSATLLGRSMADARAALEALARTHSPDDDVLLELAVAQTLHTVEKLAQSLHRYGFDPTPSVGLLRYAGLPVPPLPIPPNPEGEAMAYADLRQITQQLVDDLAEVDATLARIRSDRVSLVLPIGLVRMDFDRDGALSDEEALWRMFAQIASMPNLQEADAARFVVRLDRGDVEWLRGYTHLIRAGLQCALAYEFRDLFERTAHLVFLKVVSP